MTATLESLLNAVDSARPEVIELTQALVRVPSVSTGVMPTGNETPAMNVLAENLGRDGIASEIFESAPNRGNLVARLTGEGGGPSLMLMGHLDVVPVEDEAQWGRDPFSAEIADGRIWGRGAADMKGIVAAEAIAVRVLKRNGVRLKGDLIIAAGADEESGGAYGFDWMAKNHPEKIRADFAINEGGGYPIKRNGELIYPINVAEKGRLEVFVTVTGRGYHASAPWMAKNAIMLAQPVLDRIVNYQPERSVSAEVFRHIGKAVGISGEITDANIDSIIDRMWDGERMIASWLRAASRMTIVPTMIRAGVKSNSVAETCLITCDVRTLQWQDEAYVAKQMDAMLAGLSGVRYEIKTTAVPSGSTYDTQLTDALQKATCAALNRNDLQFIPGLTTGFTDSRLVRPLGVVAYGFAPGHPHSDASKNGAHNIDESVAIDDLMTNARAFVALAWEMLAVQ